MEGVAIIKHRSGDLYAYEENSLTGSRGYGPLHHSEVPTSPTEVLDILDNNAGLDLEADGSWLWDELEAGRAVPVATPDTNYPIGTSSWKGG